MRATKTAAADVSSTILFMTALGDLDRNRIRALHARELARFREERPRSMAMIGRAAGYLHEQVVFKRLLIGSRQVLTRRTLLIGVRRLFAWNEVEVQSAPIRGEELDGRYSSGRPSGQRRVHDDDWRQRGHRGYDNDPERWL